jgi:hypothetical protein
MNKIAKKSSYLKLLFLEQEQAFFRFLGSILSLRQMYKQKVYMTVL